MHTVDTWVLVVVVDGCCAFSLSCVVNSVVYFNSLFTVAGLVWIALLEVSRLLCFLDLCFCLFLCSL